MNHDYSNDEKQAETARKRIKEAEMRRERLKIPLLVGPGDHLGFGKRL